MRIKIKGIISFISGIITIFVFATGYEKVDEIINTTNYQKEKKKEIQTTFNKTNRPIAFEIYWEGKVELRRGIYEGTNIINLFRTYGEKITDNALKVTTKKKMFIFHSSDYYVDFAIGDIKVRKILNEKFDEEDRGFNIGEIQISGMMNEGEKQYVCYLFGKLPFNSVMESNFYGVGYLSE